MIVLLEAQLGKVTKLFNGVHFLLSAMKWERRSKLIGIDIINKFWTNITSLLLVV